MGSNNYSIKEFTENRSFSWDSMLSGYSDYNLYQAYGWGEFKKTQGWKVGRLICNNSNKDAALSQCIYKYYKFLKTSVIWIPGGPVFSRVGSGIDLGGLRCIIEAVINKFRNGKCYLRIYPMQSYDSRVILQIREMGFQRPIQSMNQGFTYHINTGRADKEILDSLSSNWRHNLKRSLEEGFSFIHSDSPEDLSRFHQIYLETAKENKIKALYSKGGLVAIKNNLPPFGSLRLFLSVQDNKIFSGRVVCVAGKKAYDLLAAVTGEGKKRYSTYSLIWEIINWCRGQGIEYLDMSGIDPFNNKNVFNFKKGMGGDLVEHAGEWEFSTNSFLRLMVNLYISKCMKYRK